MKCECCRLHLFFLPKYMFMDFFKQWINRPSVKDAKKKNLVSQPKHVMDDQKNRLNETVLLSTQKHMLELKGKKRFTIIH